jgi:hypothetical protein
MMLYQASTFSMNSLHWIVLSPERSLTTEYVMAIGLESYPPELQIAITLVSADGLTNTKGF